MKKIIILLSFAFLGQIGKAQDYRVQVIDFSTGQTKFVSYPGITNIPLSDVTTKAQRDSINTSLRTWATNTFALKGSTGTSTGINAPFNLEISPVNNFQTWTPTNHLKKYYTPNWPGHDSMQAYRFSWSYRSDVSEDNMPDNVYNFAYNMTPSGGREGLLDAGIRWGWETNYKIGNRLAFELHWPQVTDLSGRMWRTDSYYIYKDNGETFQQSYVDNHTYYSVFQGGQQYLNIHSNNGGTNNRGIGGGLDFYGDKDANNPGSLTFWQEGFLQPVTIKAKDGGLNINSLSGLSASFDRFGNSFLGYIPGTTVFLGTEYDYRNIDRTKKLQVRGDVLTEGNVFVKQNGKVFKLVINETTGEGKYVAQ